VVALDKGRAAHFLPVGHFPAGGFQRSAELELLRRRLQQGDPHLLGVGEPLVGIDRQRVFEESDEDQACFRAKPLTASWGPPEGPFGQKAGQVLVEDQADGEAIAAMRGPPVSLFGSNVARRAEIIDGPHPAFTLEADAEIAECRSALGKQEDIARRDVAMHHALLVGVDQPVEDLGDNGNDSPDRHRPGAVGQSSGRQLGRQDSLAADNISVLDGHNVRVAQPRDQPHFPQKGLVVPLAVGARQRNLQSHPNALDAVAGLPDLAASPLAQRLCQPVLAQSPAGLEVQARRPSRRYFVRFH